MSPDDDLIVKYFLSYTGVKLPLNLVSPVPIDALENRNTYFRAGYDSGGRLIFCEKLVYGEVELRHDYEYRPDGGLSRAVIDMGGERAEVAFGEDGKSRARAF